MIWERSALEDIVPIDSQSVYLFTPVVDENIGIFVSLQIAVEWDLDLPIESLASSV